MRRRTVAVTGVLVIAFSLALFLVPAIPVTEHFPPAQGPGPGGGVSVSFTYYESVSLHYWKVGAVWVDGCVTGAAYRLVDFRMVVSLC
ncbi:MAG TPA: hypothetical protein VGR53_09565 [Nitrososphaerales archaeon]|nr:hypothetical protein [Nitrososphaerales archaeon]